MSIGNCGYTCTEGEQRWILVSVFHEMKIIVLHGILFVEKIHEIDKAAAKAKKALSKSKPSKVSSFGGIRE
jgi:hypothetical protein